MLDPGVGPTQARLSVGQFHIAGMHLITLRVAAPPAVVWYGLHNRLPPLIMLTVAHRSAFKVRGRLVGASHPQAEGCFLASAWWSLGTQTQRTPPAGQPRETATRSASRARPVSWPQNLACLC